RNADLPEDRLIQLRIGVNLGDVIAEGDDLFGNGVNVAARLEGLAEPGGVVVSAMVKDNIGTRLDLQFDDMGGHQLKNIEATVRAYRIGDDVEGAKPGSTAATDRKVSVAVLPFDNLSGDTSQQYISDGITEDITTELARFSRLTVASRLAAFHYGGKGK